MQSILPVTVKWNVSPEIWEPFKRGNAEISIAHLITTHPSVNYSETGIHCHILSSECFLTLDGISPNSF